ncbi:hypothetical protein FB567DRAFT_346852 [Paraphoma chrysanthemicola]|uniref:SET domain-containing protein n=1 Tax=Paraphoma chrysanthemicola TaxID=798071 RepID=A0A8K0R4K8_9PLEO|nr:hypothetical protein FB567DRAFT_346852 [Paraphoma chrysanthemicola]
MHSVAATRTSRRKTNKSGVTKFANTDPKKPNRILRSLYKYFWYTTSDGDTRLATSIGTLDRVPQQINDYVFHPKTFADDEYPSTFPPNMPWPPKTAQDLLLAVGSEGEECIGNSCYTDTQCYDHSCTHSFSTFKQSKKTWHDHFDLRETKDKGIGVFTKTAFKTDDVLGWYAGEILSSNTRNNQGDYLMEMPIGATASSPPESPCPSDSEHTPSSPSPSSSNASSSALTHDTSAMDMTVLIDASRRGNWTRFINHSCKPYTEFRMRRVGDVRIMDVEAVRRIPVGVELTVDYGGSYYGVDTRRRCRCGVRGFVSAKRRCS